MTISDLLTPAQRAALNVQPKAPQMSQAEREWLQCLADNRRYTTGIASLGNYATGAR